MRALNRRLALEERVNTPDAAGGYVPGWSELGVLWASIEPRNARALAHDEVAGAMNAFRIYVRGAPVGTPSRPKPGQRLVEGTRIFAIKGVAEFDTGGHFLVLHAEEEVAQ